MASDRLRHLLDALPDQGAVLPNEAAIDQARGACAAAWMTAKLAKEGGSPTVALDAIEKLTRIALDALSGSDVP